MRAYFGLGSNLANALGQPADHLKFAVAKLGKLGSVRPSSLFLSSPLGPQDQPDFHNAVCEVTLSKPTDPFQLLAFTQSLEAARQRVKLRHWGERSLDVDIIYIEGVELVSADLSVPHVGMLERSFVWLPLLELAPDLLIHPDSGETLSQWALRTHGSACTSELLTQLGDLRKSPETL